MRIITEEEQQKQQNIQESINRIREIIREHVSYTTTPDILDKAIHLQNSINEKDPQVKKDKIEIIDLVMRSEYSLNPNSASAELNKIKMKYKGKLNSFIAHVRGELSQ